MLSGCARKAERNERHTEWSNMSPVIAVNHLVKRFGDVTAVDDISFAVQEGQCFGLLGPNGAGKTTVIEVLEGIQRPTHGEVEYFGRQMNPRELYQQVGIQFQHTSLQDHLTVRDTLRLFTAFYDRPMAEQALIRLCALADFADRDTRALSGGQRQRLLLALALVNDPKIVFLDEPTTGLDPQARQHFWSLVEAIKGQGKTILLTTHYMEEAETLCDRVVIMDQGRLVVEGSPPDLLAQHFDGVLVHMDDTPVPDDLMQRYQGTHVQGQVRFQTPAVETLLADLMQARVSLHHLQIQAPNLNDLFLKLTGRALRTGG